MVVSSNRSPSPLTSRPNPPKTPETLQNEHPSRRSFGGRNPLAGPSPLTNPRSLNPVQTPANSPAETGRRNYVGKESAVVPSWGVEEKENEKDHSLKAAKLRASSTGSKNFMSPTISATSKFTPSPRKKVLVERNDPLRTSMTLTDGKATFFSSPSSDVTADFSAKSDVNHDQNSCEAVRCSAMPGLEQKKVVAEGPVVPKPSKKVTFKEVTFDSHTSTESLIQDGSLAIDLKNKPDNSSVGLYSDIASKPSDHVNVDLTSEKESQDYFPMQVLSNAEPMSSDCVNGKSVSDEKSPRRSISSPIVAPLGTGPSCPPYDPENNYLSPRPQFLRYKPNPRIELLLNKGKGFYFDESMLLEDNFTCELSDNFSDSEGTEQSQTADSWLVSEDISSIETVAQANEAQVSESSAGGSIIADETTEDIVGPERSTKPRFRMKWKSCFLLVALLTTFISMTVIDSPKMQAFVPKDLNFNLYDASEVAKVAKASFDEYTGILKQWSADSISYLLKSLPVLDEMDKIGPLQFINLTDLQDDFHTSSFFVVEQKSKGFKKNLAADEEEVEVEVEMEDEEDEEEVEVEMEDFEDEVEEVLSEVDNDEIVEKDLEEVDNLEIEEVLAAPEVLLEETNLEQTDSLTRDEPSSSFNSTALTVSVPKSPNTHLLAPSEVGRISAETKELHEDMELESSVESNQMGDQESSSDIGLYGEDIQIVERLDSTLGKQAYTAIIASLFCFVLGAIAQWVYRKQQNTTAPTVVDISPLCNNKNNRVSTRPDYLSQEEPFSKDVIGEYCTSEMSSFQRSSSYKKRELSQENDEAQSYASKSRRNTKRESLASSTEYSLGSPSYGSFTTYERIPVKHATSGDEEIVTPVRRSSRIRKQVTSQ